MVAEDNKEVKKKRDGKGVNCIDEEEWHDRTGCFAASAVYCLEAECAFIRGVMPLRHT